MKKLPYNNKRNYKYDPSKGEDYTDDPSQTVQNETESIEQIMQRYAKTGQLQANNTVYFDQEDISKIDKMFAPGRLDFTDVDDLQSRVEYLTSVVEKAQKEKEDAEKEAENKNQLKLDLKTEKTEE